MAGSPTFFEEVEVSVRVAGLALGGVAEEAGEVGMAFYVGLLCEIEVAAVGLGLACEGGLEVVVGFCALELRHGPTLLFG